MEWKYHNVPFSMDSCKYLPKRLIKQGPWSGHRKFGYDLVRFTNPQKVVELGTHWGGSFLSFCQAVKDEGIQSKCFGVDTWKGDPQSGFYGEEVYKAVSKFVNAEYSGIGTLIRSTFDKALDKFADDSIDLLHIDGFHTYRAVLHDYSTWHRKVAENGIVLFHDIAVKRKGFGVYLLWNGLKQYPHIEFHHSSGLGVLFPKGIHPDYKEIFLKKSQFKIVYSRNKTVKK